MAGMRGDLGSAGAAADPVGQRVQGVGVGQAAAAQGLVCLVEHAVGVGLCGVQPHQCHKGGFVGGGVFAGGFAQGGRVGGDIENIVHDLKGQAQCSAVVLQGRQCGRRRTAGRNTPRR